MNKKIFCILLSLIFLLTACGKNEKINLETCTFDEYISYYASFIELGEYKNLEYNKLSTTVTNAEIENELINFLYDNNTYTNSKKGEIKDGDIVNIDITCSVDNKKIDYFTTDDNGTDIIVGNNTTLDNFESTLIGHTPGEVYETEITFPEDYFDETLQNKIGILKISINYIKVPNYTELTDEFVSKNSNYATVEELRENTKKELQEKKETEALSSMQSEIFNKAFKNATMKDYDKELIAEKAAEVLKPIKENAIYYGMEYEEYVKAYYEYDSTDEFEKYIASVALTDFNETCLVCAIAKKENITVNEDDVNKQIQQLASTYNVSEENIKNAYSDNQIKYMALEAKIIVFLSE